MSHVLYAYIGTPTQAQVGSFVRGLVERGISISHLGQKDPPPKFSGSIDAVASMVFGDADGTGYTFPRDAARKLGLTFTIHDDPRWTRSTVSASCPDSGVLASVAASVSAGFDSFITIRGVSSGGKDQPWEVVHVTESCPHELRSKFVVA